MKLPRRRPFYSLALCLMAATLVVSACRPKITAPPEPPLAVRLGDDAFRLQDYEAAIEDYRVYIDGVERGEYTPLAFYQTALCWYRLEQFEQALDVLSELDRRYPNEHWVQVDALRGDAQYKLERRSAALLAWDEGWSVAEANERPELRRRIVNVLREMDEGELAETREIVENSEVEALVEHRLAIAQRRPGSESVPFDESGVASATVPSRSAGRPPTAMAETESASATASTTTRSSAPDAGEVAARADEVSAQAEEVARLSDELDQTGDDVFEAIEVTEQAAGEIRAVDESSATYAPLLRVDIPEPPFVDRPVPEPKKRILVALPAEMPAPAPETVSPAAAPSGGAVQEEQIISAPEVGLERVDPSAAAAVTEESTQPAAFPPGAVAKVACVLPLTGADRSAGENLLRSVRLIFGEGSNEIIFRDSGSDPAAVRDLVAALSADSDVLIAIAPASARDASAIAGSAERAAVPLLLVSPSTVPNSRYVLSVRSQRGQEEDDFASEYRARYGASPDDMSSRAYNAALLARRALQIAPVPRAEVLSRIAVLPPPSAPKISSSAGRSASPPAANAG